MTGSDVPPPKRPRHLIDPSNPRKPPTAADHARLQRVQRWVLSILIATTILHLALALVIYAILEFDRDKPGPLVALNLVAAAFGVVAVAAGLAIHRRSPVTPWVLLGTLPGLFGIWWTLLR